MEKYWKNSLLEPGQVSDFLTRGVLKVSFVNEKKRQRVISKKNRQKLIFFKNWSTYHWENFMLALPRYIGILYNAWIILYSTNKKK